VGVPTIKNGPMTVEEYFAFTDTRPDNEKWELIDGEPILNASPSGLHHRILWNLAILLGTIERRQPQSWEATPGIGVRVSDTSLPEPDVFILPAGTIRRDPYSKETQDVLVAFEILSPSTAERDLRWKRTALAHALRGDRPGRGRSGGVRARRRIRGAAPAIARRFARTAGAGHFAAAGGDLSRHRR
jgi:Uma2 family endonuclease